jgi:hypothetical protein
MKVSMKIPYRKMLRSMLPKRITQATASMAVKKEPMLPDMLNFLSFYFGISLCIKYSWEKE